MIFNPLRVSNSFSVMLNSHLKITILFSLNKEKIKGRLRDSGSVGKYFIIHYLTPDISSLFTIILIVVYSILSECVKQHDIQAFTFKFISVSFLRHDYNPSVKFFSYK